MFLSVKSPVANHSNTISHVHHLLETFLIFCCMFAVVILLAQLFEEKSRAIVFTPASGSVKFFVTVYFSKTIKGIHLKLGILVHYQKRNQLLQGR